MLQTLRFAASVLALLPLAAFARGSFPRGRRFVAARHGARIALFTAEVASLAAWAACMLVLRCDRALVHGRWEAALAIAGALLAPAGTAFGAWGKLRLGRLFSPTFGVQENHALVTDGPYAITRHPLYTGVLAYFLGLALLWNSAVTLGLTGLVAILLWAHTLIEEKLFSEHFGEAFVAYRRRVPRLVPFTRWGRRG